MQFKYPPQAGLVVLCDTQPHLVARYICCTDCTDGAVPSLQTENVHEVNVQCLDGRLGVFLSRSPLSVHVMSLQMYT